MLRYRQYYLDECQIRWNIYCSTKKSWKFSIFTKHFIFRAQQILSSYYIPNLIKICLNWRYGKNSTTIQQMPLAVTWFWTQYAHILPESNQIYIKILQIFRFRYCLREVVAPPILARFQNFYMFWKATILIRSFLALLMPSRPAGVPKPSMKLSEFG